MKKIRILIGKDGKATVSVEGVQGKACLDLSRVVEEALGEVIVRQLCDDCHEEVSEQTTEQSRETIQGG